MGPIPIPHRPGGLHDQMDIFFSGPCCYCSASNHQLKGDFHCSYFSNRLFKQILPCIPGAFFLQIWKLKEQMAAFWGFGISMPVFFGHTNFPRNISRNIAAFPSRRTPWRKRPKWHSMRPKGQEPARCHSPAGLEIPFKWAGITAESRFPESIFAQMGGDDLVGCLLKKEFDKYDWDLKWSEGYSPGNLHIPSQVSRQFLKMMFPFPKAGYVSSLEVSGVAGCCFMVFPVTSSAMDWGRYD